MKSAQNEAQRDLLVTCLEEVRDSGWYTYTEACLDLQARLTAFFSGVAVGPQEKVQGVTQALICTVKDQEKVQVPIVQVEMARQYQTHMHKRILNITCTDEILVLFDKRYVSEFGELEAFRTFAKEIAEGDCLDPGHKRSYACDVCNATALLSKYP